MSETYKNVNNAVEDEIKYIELDTCLVCRYLINMFDHAYYNEIYCPKIGQKVKLNGSCKKFQKA